MVLQGTEWFTVGFFVNAIAELRLVDNFNDRLGLALLSIKKGDIPEFQCDVGTIYNKNVPTKVYRVLTNSKSNVHALQKLLKVIWSSPTNDVSFIPYTVWEILSEPKKRPIAICIKVSPKIPELLHYQGYKTPYLRSTQAFPIRSSRTRLVR